MFEHYINQINSIISDQSMKVSFDSREFFGYILISQIETVESVRQLENKYDNVSVKSENLEKMVEFLVEKCVLLEKNIDELKRLMSDHSLSNIQLSDLSNQCIKNDVNDQKLENKDCQTQSGLSSYKIESLDSKTVLDSEEVKSDGSCSNLTIEQDHREIQRLFNKRVKYEVNKKFGQKFLAEHQVRELDEKIFAFCQEKVVKLFSPFPLPIKAAWNNAMNSLRQDRHQLKKRYKSV